jgi:hypothetical protein
MLLSRVLIANMKNMGQCPCPRCTIRLTDIKDLGKAKDIQTCADGRKPTPQLFHTVKRA